MIGDDYIAFREGDKWGFRSADGETVIDPAFDSAGSFSEGLARVRVGNVWGFIATDGRMAIEPQFEQARHFSGGCAKVKQDGRWGLIDTSGVWAENVESQIYLDDLGQFISQKDHQAWEKPPGKDEEREGE